MADRGRGAIINIASTVGLPADPVHRDLRRHEGLRPQPLRGDPQRAEREGSERHRRLPRAGQDRVRRAGRHGRRERQATRLHLDRRRAGRPRGRRGRREGQPRRRSRPAQPRRARSWASTPRARSSCRSPSERGAPPSSAQRGGRPLTRPLPARDRDHGPHLGTLCRGALRPRERPRARPAGLGERRRPEGYERTTVAEQAGLAARRLRERGPAVVCGAGIGAVAALELLLGRAGSGHGAVLVEPPLLSFLPEATDQLLADVAEVREAVPAGGQGSGARRLPGRAASGAGPGRRPDSARSGRAGPGASTAPFRRARGGARVGAHGRRACGRDAADAHRDLGRFTAVPCKARR